MSLHPKQGIRHADSHLSGNHSRRLVHQEFEVGTSLQRFRQLPGWSVGLHRDQGVRHAVRQNEAVRVLVPGEPARFVTVQIESPRA